MMTVATSAGATGHNLRGADGTIHGQPKNNAGRIPPKVQATTVIDDQIIDWIDPQTQVLDGVLANPPLSPPVHSDNATRALFLGDDNDSDFLVHSSKLPGPKEGLVPVLRSFPDDSAESAPMITWETGQLFLSTNCPDRSHYVEAHQTADNSGLDGGISIWNPYVQRTGEVSGANAVIIVGSGESLDYIGVGWRKPFGSKAPQVHLFATVPDQWIQVSDSVFPGQNIARWSTVDGPQYTMDVGIQLFEGNWWVKAMGEWMGYLPASVFKYNGLRFGSDNLHWAGVVSDAGSDCKMTHTDMGSGRFPAKGWKQAAFMKNLLTLVGSEWEHFSPTEIMKTDSACYSIEFDFDFSTTWGSHFYFGGSGQNSGCPA